MKINNTYNRHTASNAKGKRASYEERVNPINKIVRLINQYHAIDLIQNATKEEKDWAKSRLHKMVINTLKSCSNDIQGKIKASLKSKDVWEKTRDEIT